MSEQSATEPQVDELLDYFWPHPYPQSHPPIEVVFSNGLPESSNDHIHKVFVVPYHTFKTAIEAKRAEWEREAKIAENDYHWHHQKAIEREAKTGVSGYFLERIKALKEGK